MAKWFTSLLALYTFSAVAQTDARQITQTLCSPKMHGRGYVNSGDVKAGKFLAKTFRKMGVEPLTSSYFQTFHHAVNTFPGKCSMRTENVILTPGVHFLADPSSGGGKWELKPLIVEARSLFIPGKIPQLLAMTNSTQNNSIAIDWQEMTTDSSRQVTAMIQQLSEQVPVIEITKKKFTWSVSHEATRYPHILIQDSVFQPNSTYQLNLKQKHIKRYASNNVIASIPSKTETDKTIFITAHYDHLGRMGNKTYFPGANDNASGTTMLFSLAKHFKHSPIAANLVFIAFAGEEAGLLGSKHFVVNPIIPLQEVDFVLNLDIMGSGEDGITVVNATLHDSLFQQLKRINTEQNLLKEIKARGPAANSDHYWFSQKGIPAFFIYTMGPNKNYHDVFDTYENLSFSAYDNILTLLTLFLVSL
jgi:aminopeptidase YwaD